MEHQASWVPMRPNRFGRIDEITDELVMKYGIRVAIVVLETISDELDAARSQGSCRGGVRRSRKAPIAE